MNPTQLPFRFGLRLATCALALAWLACWQITGHTESDGPEARILNYVAVTTVPGPEPDTTAAKALSFETSTVRAETDLSLRLELEAGSEQSVTFPSVEAHESYVTSDLKITVLPAVVSSFFESSPGWSNFQGSASNVTVGRGSSAAILKFRFTDAIFSPGEPEDPVPSMVQVTFLGYKYLNGVKYAVQHTFNVLPPASSASSAAPTPSVAPAQ